MTRKWNIVNDQSNANYDAENEITQKTEVLRSNHCDYNNAYILVRCGTTIIAHAATQKAWKSYAPFTKCITKIDGTIVHDAEDLDLVIKCIIY